MPRRRETYWFIEDDDNNEYILESPRILNFDYLSTFESNRSRNLEEIYTEYIEEA